jgi:hypothetical protein
MLGSWWKFIETFVEKYAGFIFSVEVFFEIKVGDNTFLCNDDTQPFDYTGHICHIT